MILVLMMEEEAEGSRNLSWAKVSNATSSNDWPQTPSNRSEAGGLCTATTDRSNNEAEEDLYSSPSSQCKDVVAEESR